MRDLKLCRTQDLDDIFYATKDSQGTNNAILAIKYVLFDDETVFKDKKPVPNKFQYISSTNNARKKAMILQKDDLAHIMIKYCMASFGLRNSDFTITDEEFLIDRKRIDRLEITPYEMIEKVAYAATGDVELAYSFLFANKSILSDVVEYMIEERFFSELKDSLDNYSGIIDNNDIKTEVRFAFYEAYNNLDDSFADIKRNNPEYIK